MFLHRRVCPAVQVIQAKLQHWNYIFLTTNLFIPVPYVKTPASTVFCTSLNICNLMLKLIAVSKVGQKGKHTHCKMLQHILLHCLLYVANTCAELFYWNIDFFLGDFCINTMKCIGLSVFGYLTFAEGLIWTVSYFKKALCKITYAK